MPCATRFPGSRLLATFHLPGDGKPAPSTKNLIRPFRCGFKVLPMPHQPAPSIGRGKSPSSRSTSVVASPGSSTFATFRSSSMTASMPSLMGRSIPFLSNSIVAVFTSAAVVPS